MQSPFAADNADPAPKSKPMTRFVIVTPVMNGADFIAANLASVAAQTDPDWVHYLVDGGSTDGTLDIIKVAVASDPRRRLISGPDRGLYDAVFKGFDQAAADGIVTAATIFAWLGADDLLMPWAVATLRQQFDETGADWMTALPAIWDFAGRQVVVQPSNWYPRTWIRLGLFNNWALGAIQQECTFFTYDLLTKLSAAATERIRTSRYAGDFLLWREFASHTALVPIPATVAGFRKHGANLSTVGADAYLREIRESGGTVPPRWVSRISRLIYRPLATLATASNFRKSCLRFEADSFRSPSMDRARP